MLTHLIVHTLTSLIIIISQSAVSEIVFKWTQTDLFKEISTWDFWPNWKKWLELLVDAVCEKNITVTSKILKVSYKITTTALGLVIIVFCCCLQALGPALLSCVEPPERISFIESNFPLQSQHYPAFQSPEPYYNSHNSLGEAPTTLQKPTNPRLYMGRPSYDFPGYLASSSYPATSDLCDPRSASHMFITLWPSSSSSASSSSFWFSSVCMY